MTFQEVKEMVANIGYPYAYRAFQEGTEQATPFVCFFFAGSDDMFADDANYKKIEHLVIELYTDYKDFTKEATVEAVLAANDMTWVRSEDEIPSERMYMVTYDMDVVINLTEE